VQYRRDIAPDCAFLLCPASSRGVEWRVNSSASPYLSLSTVIRALRGSVGGWVGRGILSSALVLLLYRRLGGICEKMERLASRLQAGGIWRVATRRVAVAGSAADRPARAEATQQWPRQFGWLVRAASYHAAVYGIQLRAILGQPEMVALLLAVPQAARILRPLCRMLAVETSLLRPRMEGVAEPGAQAPGGPEAQAPGGPEAQAPGGPEAQAPGGIAPSDVVAVVKTRVRSPRKVVDWGRIPLPRGVLAAARRQGFGKVG